MSEITIDDRVGVVMGSADEGLGAANFLLSCVIEFYDTLRECKDEFFEYPDFYTFQATTDPADYRMFDVYPDHKNVEVAAEAETILRAVNDRAISVLLVPDRSQKHPEIEDITRRSAERTIEHVYLYDPSGLLDDDGFEISVPRQPVTDWFESTADSMINPPPKDSLRFQSGQQDRISQSYREISLEKAIERLF
ncbi:hypothetical protein [Salinigranum salinum]|uniref:hypothetical protein n=1 Tax=Salinigranum salinum TaxID=1364937 RepID=UPI0019583A44|nr:hypothetical protein [Salinigranum salinum]